MTNRSNMDTGLPDNPPEEKIAIVAVTRGGVDLALQIREKLSGTDCFVPQRHAFALAMGATGFARVAEAFSAVWDRYDALVCIMAAGIVVRGIAPLVRDKRSDPAVVVLDERGKFVVSLLSGHIGGANRLAEQVASIVGGQAVVTTASDVQHKPALDLLAGEAGLVVEDPAMLVRLSRAVVEDEPIRLYDPENRIAHRLSELPNVLPLQNIESSAVTPESEAVSQFGCPCKMEPVSHHIDGLRFAPPILRDYYGTTKSTSYFHHQIRWLAPYQKCRMGGAKRNPSFSSFGRADGRPDCDTVSAAGIWISERAIPPGFASHVLALRPPVLSAGIGCNRGTPAEEILDLVRSVFRDAGLSPLSIVRIGSIDLKADEPGLLEAARILGRPIVFYSRHELEGVEVPNPSAVVASHTGAHSVCEASALLSARKGTLIVTKKKSKNVTLAVARDASPS